MRLSLTVLFLLGACATSGPTELARIPELRPAATPAGSAPRCGSHCVEGRSCSYGLGLPALGIPWVPLSPRPDAGEALREAVATTPGATGLADARIGSDVFYALVFGRSCLVVEGRPLVKGGRP